MKKGPLEPEKKEQELRWFHFQNLSGEEMLPLVRDRVFPHFKTIALDEAGVGE